MKVDVRIKELNEQGKLIFVGEVKLPIAPFIGMMIANPKKKSTFMQVTEVRVEDGNDLVTTICKFVSPAY